MLSAVKSAGYVAALIVAGALLGCGRGDTPVGDPCSNTMECVPNSICFKEVCVGEGAMRVSLAFQADSDFDLHLQTPDGEHIYFGNKNGTDGTLDVDQCIGTCGSGWHVENIVFSTNAPAGTYSVWVENYTARSAGTFTIEVAGAVTQTFNGSLPGAADYEQSQVFTFTK